MSLNFVLTKPYEPCYVNTFCHNIFFPDSSMEICHCIFSEGWQCYIFNATRNTDCMDWHWQGLARTLLGSHYYLKNTITFHLMISRHHGICKFHDKDWTKVTTQLHIVRTIFNYLIYWVRVLGVVNSPNPSQPQPSADAVTIPFPSPIPNGN